MTHTITEKELDDWLRRPQWQVFASSAGDGSNKQLLVDEGRVFRVINHGETTFLGTDRAAAIETYNQSQCRESDDAIARVLGTKKKEDGDG